MAEEKLIKANLDEKNICTDWIENEVYNNNIINTPKDNYPTCSIIGFYRDCLVETSWSSKNNYVNFHFIQTNPYKYSIDDVEELIKLVNELTKDYEGVVIKTRKQMLIDGDTLLTFRFFFKDE